jgi:cytochrome P450
MTQAQQKVFEEIHDVCKGERLPEDADDVNLPLTKSFIYEVLRLRNPIALSLPHVSTKDEIYNDYFIPDGSIILMDMYNIGMCPRFFICCFEA